MAPSGAMLADVSRRLTTARGIDREAAKYGLGVGLALGAAVALAARAFVERSEHGIAVAARAFVASAEVAATAFVARFESRKEPDAPHADAPHADAPHEDAPHEDAPPREELPLQVRALAADDADGPPPE